MDKMTFFDQYLTCAHSSTFRPQWFPQGKSAFYVGLKTGVNKFTAPITTTGFNIYTINIAKDLLFRK